MKKSVLILFSILALMACRKAEDLSAVDPKPLDLEGNMDKGVKPGDNFFMYNNGGWYKNTSLGVKHSVGLIDEATDEFDKRFASLSCEAGEQLMQDVERVDNTSAEAIEYIKQHLALVENITTAEQAREALIKTMQLGYDNLISLTPDFKGGVTYLSFTFPQEFAVDFSWAELAMTKLGVDNPSRRVQGAKELYDKLSVHKPAVESSIDNLLKYPERRDLMRPLIQTKAAGSSLLSEIIRAYGVNPNVVSLDDKMDAYFALLENASPMQIQSLLQCHIVYQYVFTSTSAFNELINLTHLDVTLKDVVKSVGARCLNYTFAREYTTKYVSTEMKANVEKYCEEIRVAFQSRLAQLDWMSETTKQRAKEKLEAVTFNVGYPKAWLASALPKLKGTTLVEDLRIMSAVESNLCVDMAGQPAKESFFHFQLASGPASSVNATYIRIANSISIFPAWLLSPINQQSASDAWNYGVVLTVIGHELTHGFDNNGSQYNKVGDKENWWTVSDQMAYKVKQQQLITCYNLLEIMPVEMPGVYGNGTKTLGENMADLGGVLVAFQAYNTKLHAEGYKDEELIKQQKKFFQSYANLWRSKYTTVLAAERLASDVHSLPKERINGVVMNIDKWYELYDVKWGDGLYLKPENRAYIW